MQVLYLIHGQGNHGDLDLLPWPILRRQNAASNISTVQCWKVVSLLLRRQREDEVEPQHREGTLAANHRVEGGIPEAGHLLGETVTAHATRPS